MVVTGDRDAYQLVDDGVRIMTTSRGITDTKVYDREGVIDRYGIPPELVPDFIGLKGDTSRQHPRRPGHRRQDRRRAAAAFGDLEGVLASVDQISGAKRKQNLTEHADDARMSKQLATMVRDVPIDIDLEAEFTREPDRSNLRDGLPRLGAARPAAPARGGARGRRARRRSRAPRTPTRSHRRGPRRRRPPDIDAHEGRRARARRRARPRSPEGELIPREPVALRRLRAAARTRSPARSTTRAELVAGRRRPPGRSPTTPRRSATSRRTSSSTPRSPPTCSTRPAAATRSTSWPRSAGMAVDADDEQAARAVLVHELAERQRPQIARARPRPTC